MSVFDNLTKEKQHEVSENLLLLVRDNNFIFNKRDDDYKNTVKIQKKFKEFARKISEATEAPILKAKELQKVWKTMFAKFRAIHVQINKAPHSGMSLEDLPEKDWNLYDDMQFVLPYLKPPPIVSSMTLQAVGKSNRLTKPLTASPVENFSKKRKKERDEVDESVKEVNKLIKLTLEKIHESEGEKMDTEENDKNPYCDVVLEAYRELDDLDRTGGLILLLSEMEILNNRNL